MSKTPLVAGLSAVAENYDAVVCDVWGVIHNGRTLFPGVAEALTRFRETRGPVVLLTNAPRPAGVVEKQLGHFGLPREAYDAIVTSGDLTREEIIARAGSQGGTLKSLYIGPDRDLGIFDAATVAQTSVEHAHTIICTGPYHDESEMPEDYRPLLTQAAMRALPMICANPDLVVQRGAQMIYCAGSLAELYETLGGKVWYAGKPHLPVYEKVDSALAKAAGRPVPRRRALMIGDGLKTDVKGGNNAGLPVLLIAGGIHGADFAGPNGKPDEIRIGEQLAKAGLTAIAASASLTW